ncbi:hypothetical protein [uncultured Mediterranean phage]|nr:hypothetical protein [uncultured Mediterranean phage]
MKEYGYVITDKYGATLSQWFNTDIRFSAKECVSTELVLLWRKLDEMPFKRAVRILKKKLNNGLVLELLYENDFTE